MRKYIVISLLAGAVIFTGYQILMKNSQWIKMGVISDKEPSIEDIIIVDSLAIDGKFIYWFCYDLGIRGYSNGKLAYAQERDEIVENIFLHSSYISDLEYDSAKSLLIIHVFEKIIVEENLGNINFEIRMDGDFNNSLEARLMRMESDENRIDLKDFQ
jgi:hypothetical protein